MIAAIMQPTYLPWIGYFKLIKSVDKFVFLDDVQFNKRSWQQRNKIFFNKKTHYLTVPIKSKGKFLQKINEVMIDESINWRNDHLKTLELAYKKTTYFEEIYNIFNSVYEKKDEHLSSLNVSLIKTIMNYLNIDKEILFSSKLNTTGNKDEKLISILKKIGASKYLSPEGSKIYIGEGEIFLNNKIDISFFKYEHPTYNQGNGQRFVKNLSIIDALFNLGKGSLKLID
ncbi:WbqC family protein [Candidatus Pelagibacter sp.]|nr:WbqC family protein [Candidatus Pelagibacter sp.]